MYRAFFVLSRVDPLGTDDGEAGENPFGFPGVNFPKPPTLSDIQAKIEEWKRKVDSLTIAAAKSECEAWAKFDKQLGDKWRKKLSKCPCTRPDKKKGWIESPTDVKTHPGCKTCFRSSPKLVPPNPLQGGQQCCYDKAGNLITSGSGSGTIDRRNPFANPLGHFIHDVYPALVCAKAGMIDVYIERRPNDPGEDANGKPCTDNPTKPQQNP